MGSLCENVVDRGGVATMGQGLVEMGNTSRLYGLVVKEREMDERDENWNLGSFKKVTRSLSKRLKKCGRVKEKKDENKEEKQTTFSLDFYFSDTDSAYCSLCPSDWNPLEITGDFCESEVTFTGISIKNPLRKVFQYFHRVLNKKSESRDGIRNLHQEGERSHSCDQMLDDNDSVSISTSIPISTSPPPILKPDNPIPVALGEKAEKTVMLLLPARRTVVATVETVLVPPGDKGDIASQQRPILCQARQQMEETFPFLSFTISILFSDNLVILLRSISSSMIGDLIFQIRTILFSPLRITIPFTEIILSVLIKFLHHVSILLHPACSSCMWEELMDSLRTEQCKEGCVETIRTGFIDIWCAALTLDQGKGR